jgi:hypothetical protein
MLTKKEVYELTKEINQKVPMIDVLKYYGLDTKRTNDGKIKCPCILHTDKVPSAKFYAKNNIVYCFSESRTMRPVDIVREREGVSAVQACRILAERYGISTYYNMSRENDPFPLNDYDYRYLGLSKETVIQVPKRFVLDKRGEYIDGYVIDKETKEVLFTTDDVCSALNIRTDEADALISKLITDECDKGKYQYDYTTDTYTVEFSVINYGLRDLYKQDKEAFSSLIYGKAVEMLEKYEKQGKFPKSDKQKVFLEKAVERLTELKQTYSPDAEVDKEEEYEK